MAQDKGSKEATKRVSAVACMKVSWHFVSANLGGGEEGGKGSIIINTKCNNNHT